MKERYRSIKQQEEMLSRTTFEDKKYYVLYDGTATSKNPYQGKNQFDSDVDERKRFLRETGRM
ncbi:hypothetical protein FP803_02045 [Candidatus Woesearchaeota archaeon]|nr:hypothetical protein [Candidatus Woesearchaeota archaeon]MBU3941287.1 hypothetical protein [Nanoarchaeota archaeon]